jgi:hypothetical protein
MADSPQTPNPHKQGKGKVNISVHARAEVAGYIDARADRLDWTRSKFTGIIVQWWLAQGAPPIHQAELLHPEIPVTPEVILGIDLTKFPISGSNQPFPTRDQDKPLKPASSGAGVARNYLSVGK